MCMVYVPQLFGIAEMKHHAGHKNSIKKKVICGSLYCQIQILLNLEIPGKLELNVMITLLQLEWLLMHVYLLQVIKIMQEQFAVFSVQV